MSCPGRRRGRWCGPASGCGTPRRLRPGRRRCATPRTWRCPSRCPARRPGRRPSGRTRQRRRPPYHRLQRLVDTPAGLEDQREERTLAQLGDAQVDVASLRGQCPWPHPLRSLTRDSRRSYRAAPITSAASASISSCSTVRTDSRIRWTASRYVVPPAGRIRQTVARPSVESPSVSAWPYTAKISPMAVHFTQSRRSPQTPPLGGTLTSPVQRCRKQQQRVGRPVPPAPDEFPRPPRSY